MEISKVSFLPVFSIEKIVNSILGFIILLSFVFNYYDQLWIRLIPVNTSLLTKIAYIGKVKGLATRRLRNDTLYLPLYKKAGVFEGDIIITDVDSSVEIFFNNNNYLIQEPDSVLKIHIENGIPLLHLYGGSLTTHFTEDTLVKIQYGLKITEVQIRKGTYLIRNTTFGIQITESASQLVIKKGKSDEDNLKVKKAETEFAEQEEIKPEKADELADDADKNDSAEAKPVALKLPYPPKDAVLLIQNEISILVAAKTNCEGPCELSVDIDGKKVFASQFTDGEFAKYDLRIKKGTNEKVHWKFHDEVTKHEDSFLIQPYTDDNFQNALDKGLPIELL